MKLTATIKATIKVKEDEQPADASERVLEKLAESCADWLNGTMAPYIKFKYTIKEDGGQMQIDKKYLN